MIATKRAALLAHLQKQDYHSLREILLENSIGRPAVPESADIVIGRILALPDEILDSICKAEGLA